VRIFVFLYVILPLTGLVACGNGNHYYGFDKNTWESMSEGQRQQIVSESHERMKRMEEEDQFHKDIDGLIDWSGKGS